MDTGQNRLERIPIPEDQPTLDAPTAGRLAYGLGRAASYAAAARGELPTVRIGRKVLVPTAALRLQLGLDPGRSTDGKDPA